NQDVVIDKVRYEGTLPWNTNALGTGSALQLLDAAQDNSRPGNWFSAFVPAVFSEPMFFPGATNTVWRPVVKTGTMQTHATDFFIFMTEPGDVYVDDIMLVMGTNAGVGPNVIQNGDFESELMGPWQFLGTNLTNSAISTALAHSGNASLHVVSSGAGTLTKTILQVLPSLESNTVHTLSYWYYTPLNGTNLNLRPSNATAMITMTNASPRLPRPATRHLTSSPRLPTPFPPAYPIR